MDKDSKCYYGKSVYIMHGYLYLLIFNQTAGHVQRLQIPSDTFEDVEDGDTSNLRLLFKTFHDRTLGHNSWIQFNPTKQEIYAL